MRTAETELQAQPEFAHVVVNDRLEEATGELERIVRAALLNDGWSPANLQAPDERPNP
jgi:guanylate kinase